MTGDPHHGGPPAEGPTDPFASSASLLGDGTAGPSVRRSWSPTDPPSPPLTAWRVLAPLLLLTAGFALAARFL